MSAGERRLRDLLRGFIEGIFTGRNARACLSERPME